MALTLDQIQAIDARVAAGERNVTAMGTVVERTFDDNAQVVFDDSQAAMPVKVGGGVEAYAGDRVALVRFGRWWIVVESMTHRWPSEAGISMVSPSGINTYGGFGFAGVPEAPSFSFVKRWNLTRTKIDLDATAKSAGGVMVEWGVKIDEPSMGSFTVGVAFLYYDLTTLHLTASGIAHVPGAVSWNGVGMPAGTYTISPVWRSPNGGNIQYDQNDRLHVAMTEVAP